MAAGMHTTVVPVKDLERAKAVYGAMVGAAPYVDEPYYVGFRVGDQEVGLDPNGHAQGMTGPVGFWEVDDIKERVQQLVDAGAQIQREVSDVGGGKLIATLTDPDGNPIGLAQEP